MGGNARPGAVFLSDSYSLTSFFLLALLAVVVGFFIGAVGVGGILLIPGLTLLVGMEIHQAAATALFSFLFTGVVGTWLFARRGSIDWRMSIPVCGGAVVFSFLGALANSLIDARPLTLVIAAIIVLAGGYILLPSRRPPGHELDGRGPGQSRLLLLVGAVSGFGSGLSGAGGPLFSVPLMVLLGFRPLAAIGVSQVLQIISALAGTVGNLKYGAVDFTVAAQVTLPEVLGVLAGVRAAHNLPVIQLRRMVAGLCIVVGIAMMARGG